MHSGLIFESSASEGAILTLPDGSNSEDLENKKQLQDYLSVHGEDMYRCALNRIIIKNGDLCVITGYDKTTNWGMATFSNSSDRTDSESFCLKFRPKDPGVEGRTDNWKSSGSAEVEAALDMREIAALPRGDPSHSGSRIVHPNSSNTLVRVTMVYIMYLDVNNSFLGNRSKKLPY